LRGLEEQVLLNILSSAVATVSKIGSIIVIIFVSSSIISYLKWILMISFFELAILYYFTWANIPKKNRVNLFSANFMKDIWKFSTTLTATTLFATILKQLDKILVSRLLPLDQMGYYMTATTVTNSLIKLVNPTVASVFPRMSSLFFQKNYQLLSELYHKATQLTQIIIAPLACLLVFFSYEILLIWTQSEAVAINTRIALTILSIAVLFNTALQTHYILVFAGGLTWIPMICNIISSIILVPIVYYAIVNFGISGAGLSWLLLNVAYFFVIPKITHFYILKSDYYRWILNDTLYYIVSSALIFSIGFVAKSYFGIHGSPIILVVVVSLILYFLSLILFKPLIFNDIRNTVSLFLNKGN
jgi:O-antigen/teichoic acid export membrane protein